MTDFESAYVLRPSGPTSNGCRHLSPGPTAWHPDGKRISSVQDCPLGERGSSNSVLLKIGQKEGVHNVHTLGFGLGRTGTGFGRIAEVFGSSQCLQGPESGSSPTSGTAFPTSEAFFASDVCTFTLRCPL
jgi:hypothetical protein